MFPAPTPLSRLPLLQLERAARAHDSQLSCSAHTRAKIGKSQHRLVPVACEQPPRSKVLDTSVVILLAP